mgnify:CR=1 FL=1
MARPTGRKPSNPPNYKLHKASGKAVVRLDGKEIYLGIHNTPESLERYQRLITENWATGKPVEAAERRLAKTMPISKADLKWLREMQNKIPEATRKRIKAKMMSSRLQAA